MSLKDMQVEFGPDRDKKALAVLEKCLVECGYEEAPELLKKLDRRPLIKWFVLRKIKQEAVAANAVQSLGAVDWEALAEFLKAIAPIIIEILKMFL